MANKADIYSKRGIRTGYVSTVIGISLVIFMIGLVLGGIFGLRSIEKQAKENIQADIFFKSELNDADIKQIEEQLKSWPEFSDVFFISPERAIQEFAGESEVEKEVLSLFDAENPLPATIGIKPKMQYASRSGMAGIKRKLMSRFKDEIDEVNYDKSSVANVNLGFKQFAILFLAVALLLIIIAVAMINNTIRLALYSKRFTIKTMQLVGATSMYIRKPFLGQALFQGLLSSLIGLARSIPWTSAAKAPPLGWIQRSLMPSSLTMHGEAARDADRLAGHEGRCPRRQKYCRSSHIGRHAQTPQRCIREVPGLHAFV